MYRIVCRICNIFSYVPLTLRTRIEITVKTDYDHDEKLVNILQNCFLSHHHTHKFCNSRNTNIFISMISYIRTEIWATLFIQSLVMINLPSKSIVPEPSSSTSSTISINCSSPRLGSNSSKIPFSVSIVRYPKPFGSE